MTAPIDSVTVDSKSVAIFAFSPDWSNGITERLEWLTDIMPARSAKEQRTSTRLHPRRTFEFDALAYGSEFGLLDVLLASWQSGIYAVPVWMDRARVGSALDAGATSIAVTTQYGDWHADGYAIIGTSARNAELVTIDSVSDDSITLKSPGTANAWSAGAFVVPARLARLALQQAVTRPTAKIASARLQFSVEDVDSATAVESSDTYGDVGVLTLDPNRVDDLSAQYARDATLIDYLTGGVTADDIPSRPFITRTWNYLFADRAEIHSFRGWLAARRGRLSPFWMPTWERSIEIEADIASDDTTITVEDQGFRNFFVGLGGRADIAILLKDGTWYFRGITAIDAGDAGEETFTIDSALGAAVATTDISIAMFLEKSRLDSDAVEIQWLTDSVAQTAIPVRSVVR